MSEIVLAGHPDKFCDQVADAVVAACMEVNPEAYCQVEVAVWADQVFLTGGIALGASDEWDSIASSLSPRERGEGGRRPGEGPLRLDLAQIVLRTAARIGDPRRFEVRDAVCLDDHDPRQWTRKVNDQSIVSGWAGYDAKTAYLPPEHWLAHRFREALERALHVPLSPLAGRGVRGEGRTRYGPGSPLAGEGPDGKLLLRIREEGTRWTLEHLLVTLQQRETTKFQDLVEGVAGVLEAAWEEIRNDDSRWLGGWDDVELLINPNGPLVNGGSDGDNGQTGRKLVMDFYGPRVPLGGGALSGKHLTHVDRCGSYAAREAAVHAVRTGARECRVVAAYAPNEPMPLEVVYEMEGRGERMPRSFFHHDAVRERYASVRLPESIALGTHFFDGDLPWNGG